MQESSRSCHVISGLMLPWTVLPALVKDGLPFPEDGVGLTQERWWPRDGEALTNGGDRQALHSTKDCA